MSLNMTPKVFSGLVEEKLEDDKGAEVFVDLIKLILKADGDTEISDVLILLDEAHDNFTSNYALVKAKLGEL